LTEKHSPGKKKPKGACSCKAGPPGDDGLPGQKVSNPMCCFLAKEKEETNV